MSDPDRTKQTMALMIQYSAGVLAGWIRTMGIRPRRSLADHLSTDGLVELAMSEPRPARGPDEWPAIAKVILGVAYVIIATFLCLAAIQDPNLDDGQQWFWCAAAVAWGPIFLFFWVLLGGEVPGDRRD